MPTFLCSAILFDLDGVLVDSTKAVEGWWRLWSRENGLDAEEVMKVMHGRPTADVVRLVAPQMDAEAEAKRIEKRASGNDGVVAMSGAAELLRRLPENRWAVVTSGTRGPATARLQFVGLPVPGFFVTADDVSRGKPDPEPYLRGARLLGVRPEECLVIEDAPLGIQSAHAAGMKVIGLATTFPAKELEADAVAESLAQVHMKVLDTKLEVEL